MRLQIHVVPANAVRTAPVTSSFLEIASPTLSLEDLCVSISNRYRRLYPHRPPLRIDKLQDSNGNDLDLCYTVEAVFFDKANDNLDSIVRVVQASEARGSSLPPESGLRPRPRGGALLRRKRPALENLREVSHESDVSGVQKHNKADLPDPGRAKRARMEDFVVLDSMDEAEIAGDVNVRNWDDRNGLTQSYTSGEGYGEEEGEQDDDDDDESFKDALMGDAPAHSGGCISPSLGRRTPEAEPTLPAPAQRGSSVRITGVAALHPSRQTEFFEVKEEITSSPFQKIPEQAKHNLSPKVNGLSHTKTSTTPRQNKHSSPSLRQRNHDSPVRTRSSLTRGSSASKHSVYRVPESSDDDDDDDDDDHSSVSKGINADPPRKRRSKSKSSVVSETASSEADDESSQMQAARKLQKEEEEQERETLIRQAETQKQTEKEKRESKALASEVEAQAKREQEAREQESRQRESRETHKRDAKAAEERDRIEKERLEGGRLKLLEQSKRGATAGAKSAVEKIAPETAVQAEASQEKAPSAKPTKEARRDTAHEVKLASREKNARRKASREQIERGELAVETAGPNEKLALVEQNGENKAAPTSLEQPGIAPVEGNQEGSTAGKTSQRKPRVRSKSGKTTAELKAEKEVKAKEKELEKKEKQGRQNVEREEKRKIQQEKKRVQQEEKERKAHEKKEAQESAKKVRQDRELTRVLEANVRAAQEKDSQEKEPQSSSNESGSVLPPVLNSALKRKDPTTSAVKKPTHVSFADVNAVSSAPLVSSPIPRVMKQTPILPPGYIPKTAAIPQSEPSTAPSPVKPPAAVTTPKPPPMTNGTAQIPPQSKNVEPEQLKGAGSSGSQETTVSTQPKGKKSPRTEAAPVKKPEPKKPEPKKSAQSKPDPKPGTESNPDTESDSDSESNSESVESAGGAIHATPTPGSKAVKIPPTLPPPMTRNLDALSATQKQKPEPATPKPKVSKGKAKSAVTRYEESIDSSSPDEKQITSSLSSSSSLPPTSAQRPKPSPPDDSGSDAESGSEIESEDESPALPPASTPAPVVLIKHPPTASSQKSGSQRYKSLKDMEMGPIPDVRDIHQASRAAAAVAGKKRQSGSNSSQARKRQEVAEQETSDDSGSSYESGDVSEEEPETKKDALAGKRAHVPKKSGFGFHLP